jgi:hypothetical protein
MAAASQLLTIVPLQPRQAPSEAESELRQKRKSDHRQKRDLHAGRRSVADLSHRPRGRSGHCALKFSLETAQTRT